jgi:NAD(P)-dependent dehydrogenase (short-subunit alcohol dehydrogenase family)
VEPFGIRVLIVEPGAFRTGLHGSAMRESAVMPEYDSIVGPTRAAQREMAGVEPGDPAKAASAILAALDADSPPLRLVLGNDAADGILAHLDSVRAELVA